MYGFHILGVLKLGGISIHTPLANAIPMYNVKLGDDFSGLLWPQANKIPKNLSGLLKLYKILLYNAVVIKNIILLHCCMKKILYIRIYK